MRKTIVGFALLLCCSRPEALAAGLEKDIFGKEFPDKEFPLERTLRLGPFRVRPFLQIKDTGYDDNVFLDDQHPTSDFTSTMEPGVKLLTLFSDRAALILEERIDYVWFAQSTTQNHFNNLARARLNVYLHRLTFFTVVDSLSLRERPGNEIDFRVRRYENVFGGGVRYERPRSSLELRIGEDEYRFASGVEAGKDIPRALNRAEGRATATGRLKVLPKTHFLAEWEERRIGFKDPASQGKDSHARRISLGFEFDPSAFLLGSLKVGVETLRPRDESKREFHGTVGEGILLYRMTSLTKLELRGRRDLSFTSAAGNVYRVNTLHGATLSQSLAERVVAEVGVDREKNDYPERSTLFNPQTGTLESAVRFEKIRSYFLGGSYRFTNRTRVGLRAGIWERDSTFDFRNRRRMTAQMTYTYDF